MNATSGQKRPQFGHEKPSECRAHAGVRDVTKATGVGKELVPCGIPARPIHGHTRPFCALLHTEQHSTPYLLLPALLQAPLTSTDPPPWPQVLPSGAFQGCRVPSDPLAGSDFLLKDGEMTSSYHMAAAWG